MIGFIPVLLQACGRDMTRADNRCRRRENYAKQIWAEFMEKRLKTRPPQL
ncbi:hypothetical protein PO124_05260 [Bacillus licheniformis]|nr:hypothetical protein [Bacillus licheniformis]